MIADDTNTKETQTYQTTTAEITSIYCSTAEDTNTTDKSIRQHSRVNGNSSCILIIYSSDTSA